MNPQEHMAAALDFLALAEVSLVAQKNHLLRSELLWCAAAHAIKSVAKRGGWQNRSHADLFDVAERLSVGIDVRIESWFQMASLLHRNMYEGEMGEQEIATAQEQVRRLVHLLETLVS